MSESVKTEGLLGMLTVKLQDDNFVKWSFQFQSVLRGYDLFDFFTGDSPCPPKYVINTDTGVTTEITTAYKDWVKKDLALLSLLIATLSDDAMEHVIGCRTSQEAWTCLQERFASVSMVRVNQLKTEFHTAQKGGDSIDKFMLRLKGIRDQLLSAGEKISDNDYIIAVLSGLPADFEVIKTVILARDSIMSLKDFRAQLLGAEASIEARMQVLSNSMSAMYVQGDGASSSRFQGGNHNYEHGESSNSQRSENYSSFQGGSGFVSNGNRFQQRGNFSGNNRKFNGSNGGNGGNNGGNYTSRSFSGNFSNRFGNNSMSGTGNSGNESYSGNGKSSYFNGNSSGKGGSWNGNTNYKSAISPECQICSRRGHTAPNCFYRADNNGPPPPFVVCQICGKKGHIALECYHRNNFSYQGNPPPPSLTALTAQTNMRQPHTNAVNDNGFNAAETWILDTGATHHMTANATNINQAAPYNGNEKIIIGNGEGLIVKSIGSSVITTSSDKSLILKNVLHVPMITVNLLSVKKLCKDNGCWFICDDVMFFIQDKATRVILYQGMSDGGELFRIPASTFSDSFAARLSRCAAFIGKKVTASVWHQRFGHPSEEVLQAMLRSANIVPTVDTTPTVCSSCIQGKMSRQPFPSREHRASFLFEKVHSDIWGPAPSQSVQGYRYYINFVDEFSRFMWVFPMTNKSEAFSIFVKFQAFVFNQFNVTIKCLQTDGGGEYMSKVFVDFLANKGITHMVSCPHTPQQNGLAERKHRHVVETTVTLMSQANLSSKFWYHACAYAVMLINRMPCRVLQMKCPYQIVFGHSPAIQQFKIFGTAVYPFLRPFNSNKLQPRSSQCVFLGFSIGYKGVICFDPNTGRFIVSRHVIHDEEVFPFKCAVKPKQGDRCTEAQDKSIPVLIQMPIPQVQPSQYVHSQNSDEVPILADVSQPSHTSIGAPGLSETSDASSFHPHHHHSTTPTAISPLLPVHHESQLEVILPVSPDSIDRSTNSSMTGVHTSHPMITRLKSGTIMKKNYAAYLANFPELQSLHIPEDEIFSGGFSFITEVNTCTEPTSFRQASSIPQWQQAMQEEYDSLRAQGTWSLIPSPPDRSIVGSKWVYKVKKNQDGSVSRYKARLVAQGFSQEHGVDYSETFSPVVRHTTVRIVLALAAMNHWNLKQLDIKNAFLHGELQEEVYMKQPSGFVDPQHPTHVCKLLKSLYGLKQAPRAWNSKFTSYLLAMGFIASSSDTSLFTKKDHTDIVILLLYVDDIILTGSNSVVIQSVVNELSEVFDLKDLGRLTYFLGLQVQYKANGDIYVNQAKYITDLIHKAGMDSCKPAPTPCKPHNSMLMTEGTLLPDPSIYISLVGSLQYLTFTRPDISFAVNCVCQHMTKPTDIHLGAVKRIIRYLQGTIHAGVVYSATAEPCLSAFSDSDWAADLNTRRSVTGYVVFLGNNPISWQSKKQSAVSRSSTEAEYKALAHTASDIAWVRNVLKDLDVFLSNPPVIFCDNMSAIALSANPVFHSRIKHLDTDFHFIRERVQQGDLEVAYIPTDEQTADVLTKGLHSPTFVKHCFNLKLGTPVDIAGG